MEQGSLNEVASKALEFRRQYYSLLDNKEERPKLMELYAPDTPNLCEWNGHALPDLGALQQYFANLPRTAHAVDSVDAQPLPGNEGADSFLMTVHGIVTYDDEHKREFFQRLVVRKVNNRYYIVNDYYRWLSERN